MIRELLASARASEAPRNPQRAAVSDLYGCDLATWFRRNGYVPPAHDEATLRKFDLGHAVEAQIARRLGQLGVWVERDVLVALKPTDEGMEARQVVCKCVPDWECTCSEKVPMDEMTGHPDLWLPHGATAFGSPPMRSLLIEVKTTDVRTPKDECSPHYALQAAAYAIALEAKDARVHVSHVVPFDKPEKEYFVNARTLRPRVIERLHEVMERTDPGAPMPEAKPPAEAAWACKYCPYAQCPENDNPKATLVPPPELSV